MPDPAGYEVIRSLGVGSMGPVYLARQVAHNREVAVKRILGATSRGRRSCARSRTSAGR